MIRTRFAPSPTGFLHIGGARTALFSWAYARHFQGEFILRIEDTDLERSTPEAVTAILQGMEWLGLEHDLGPYYQSKRMDRYRQVVADLLASGHAYHCYMSAAELDNLRESQRAQGEKPRYNGFWRPAEGKTLPAAPVGVAPVVRFKTPLSGVTAWEDQVKGLISFQNSELDDLIIARADGTPTYNFCVVVDDWEMKITHVIRGDDHVNNTPRQINILRALGAQLPQYAHLSMINGADGQKLSKRHGAVSVMQYRDEGYLPEALINYLARLGWSHGDAEIFNRQQLVEWFDLEHITAAAAQFDYDKLRWLNNHYMKQMPAADLLSKVIDLVSETSDREALLAESSKMLLNALKLYVGRCHDLCQLANVLISLFIKQPSLNTELCAKHIDQTNLAALKDFTSELQNLSEQWENEKITILLKNTLSKFHIKMPQLAIPLRVILLGEEQSPAIDAIIYLLGAERCSQRLQLALANLA